METTNIVRGQRWLRWVIPVLASLNMFAAALIKMIPGEGRDQALRQMQIEPEIATKLGILILTMLVLYWVPRTAFLGAILLTAYLGGAVCFHILVSKTPAFMPALLAVLFWIGYGLRNPEVMIAAGLVSRKA